MRTRVLAALLLLVASAANGHEAAFSHHHEADGRVVADWSDCGYRAAEIDHAL
jgi:hypothetical protein